MNDPLANLRDIHLPSAIGWWPLAPGWWLVIAGVLLFTLLLTFYLWKRYWSSRQIALRHLNTIETTIATQSSNVILWHLAVLIKRLVLAYAPRKEVAKLHGQAWIHYCNQMSKHALNDSTTILLTEKLYQTECKSEIKPCIQNIRAWIKGITKP